MLHTQNENELGLEGAGILARALQNITGIQTICLVSRQVEAGNDYWEIRGIYLRAAFYIAAEALHVDPNPSANTEPGIAPNECQEPKLDTATIVESFS